MPYGADNALITAAEVVRRLVAYRPHAEPGRPVAGPPRLAGPARTTCARALSDPATIDDAIASLPPAHARVAHACSHTTISPNVIHGGQKTNTIPDVIDIDVDMRTVPGDTQEVVDGYLAEALGDLAERVEICTLQDHEPTRSPIDNPLWEALRTRTQVAYPGAELVPGLITGGTDSRFYREQGSVAYGAALFSPSVTLRAVRQPLPRQRRAHRRRVARPVDRLLVPHRQADGRLTTVKARQRGGRWSRGRAR